MVWDQISEAFRIDWKHDLTVQQRLDKYIASLEKEKENQDVDVDGYCQNSETGTEEDKQPKEP